MSAFERELLVVTDESVVDDASGLQVGRAVQDRSWNPGSSPRREFSAGGL